jgi:hypothetical protein
MKNAAFAKEARYYRKGLDEHGIEVLARARKGLPFDDADGDLLFDLVMNSYGACAETVLTLGWDGNHPGGAGGQWLKHCEGVYIIDSSDEDSLGPFFSLREALNEGFFDRGAANPELYSDFLPRKTLLALARTIVDWDNSATIRINEQWYRASGNKLVLDKK